MGVVLHRVAIGIVAARKNRTCVKFLVITSWKCAGVLLFQSIVVKTILRNVFLEFYPILWRYVMLNMQFSIIILIFN